MVFDGADLEGVQFVNTVITGGCERAAGGWQGVGVGTVQRCSAAGGSSCIPT